MQTITRIFTFDSGHRVLGHEGKCASLHGHTYKAEVEIRVASTLDSLGRVVDFSVVKTLVGEIVDELDHRMLLYKKDPLALMHPTKSTVLTDEEYANLVGPREPIILPFNPTAENLAAYLADSIQRKLDHWCTLLPERCSNPLWVAHVRLWETPNCFADYTP